MGLIAKIFGNPKKEIPIAKGYKESPEKALVDGALNTVKLASMLLGILGKWISLFIRDGILHEALASLDDKELKCLTDFFPEFIEMDS
jgi:hypothetical protein